MGLLKSAPAALRPTSGAISKSSIAWIAAAAAVVLGCHLQIALARGINWDEFHHYSIVQQFAAGSLNDALQTFYARLYVWIIRLPGDVTDQIRAARIVMLACVTGASIAIFGLSRRFASDLAAALTALAYLSAGFVVLHGTAFRADPQAALLLMSALWLLSCARLTPLKIASFGLIVGLAAMITIKVVFWAPAFAGIAWLRLKEGPQQQGLVWRIAACGGAGAAVFFMLYAWHAGAVSNAPIAQGGTLSSAGRVVFSEGLLPQWRDLAPQLVIAPHVTVLILVTMALWPKLAITRARGVAMVGLLLPALVVLVYRNSYPYFLVFLLPPILVATAPAMDQALRLCRGPAPIAVLSALVALALAWQEPRSTLPEQKRVIRVAHQLFPHRITYFDFCGYLGDYDRALPFMPSGWGLFEYRRAGRPRYVEVMKQKPVPLLLLNHNVLVSAVLNRRAREQLLEADAVALRENYIYHWGPLWIAGKTIPAGPEPLEALFRVPGAYTLEGGELTIDGVLRRPGDVIELGRGVHHIAGSRPAQSTLRWGDHLEPSPEPPFLAGPYSTFDLSRPN